MLDEVILADLERFNPLTPQSLLIKDRAMLPSTSGVYFVHNMSAVLYVGQSMNINIRWSGDHHHRYDDFNPNSDYISWITIPCGLLDDVECFFFEKFKPTFNDPSFHPSNRRIIKQKDITITLNESEYMLVERLAALHGKTTRDVALDVFRKSIPYLIEEIESDLKVRETVEKCKAYDSIKRVAPSKLFSRLRTGKELSDREVEEVALELDPYREDSIPLVKEIQDTLNLPIESDAA